MRCVVVGFVLMALGLAACTSEHAKPSAQGNGSGSDIVFSSGKTSTTTPRAGLGKLIGEVNGRDVMVGTGSPALGRSLVKSMAYLARSDGAPTQQARTTFIGSGQSASDLLRPAKRPINVETDYVTLAYGYLAAIDPGGVVEHVEFYEDDNGCETDVLTRRAKDGSVRVYFVDTTGWHDKTFADTGDLPKRTCAR